MKGQSREFIITNKTFKIQHSCSLILSKLEFSLSYLKPMPQIEIDQIMRTDLQSFKDADSNILQSHKNQRKKKDYTALVISIFISPATEGIV